MNIFVKLFIISIIFSSCSVNSNLANRSIKSSTISSKASFVKRPVVAHTLDEAVIELAEQLFLHSVKFNRNKKIALTTFVNIDKLKDSSTFGRAVSESLINELHIRNFNIIDLRTQKNISTNQKGQFFISREAKRLKKKKDYLYILVGTYSLFDYDSLVLNARFIDSNTSEVISTARVIYSYKDCKLFNLCGAHEKMKIVENKNED